MPKRLFSYEKQLFQHLLICNNTTQRTLTGFPKTIKHTGFLSKASSVICYREKETSIHYGSVIEQTLVLSRPTCTSNSNSSRYNVYDHEISFGLSPALHSNTCTCMYMWSSPLGGGSHGTHRAFTCTSITGLLQCIVVVLYEQYDWIITTQFTKYSAVCEISDIQVATIIIQRGVPWDFLPPKMLRKLTNTLPKNTNTNTYD